MDLYSKLGTYIFLIKLIRLPVSIKKILDVIVSVWINLNLKRLIKFVFWLLTDVTYFFFRYAALTDLVTLFSTTKILTLLTFRTFTVKGTVSLFVAIITAPLDLLRFTIFLLFNNIAFRLVVPKWMTDSVSWHTRL